MAARPTFDLNSFPDSASIPEPVLSQIFRYTHKRSIQMLRYSGDGPPATRTGPNGGYLYRAADVRNWLRTSPTRSAHRVRLRLGFANRCTERGKVNG